MTTSYPSLLVSQLTFYWDVHLRPRLDGMTDEEYLWEPVAGCWSIRVAADGGYTMDRQSPRPEPEPVTTIAWRMAHLAVDNLGERANHFFETAVAFNIPGTAAEGIMLLERGYNTWLGAISALDDVAMQMPLGPKGGQYADDSMAELVLHVNRETMHHGGEICLLRDLYRAGMR